MDLDDYRREWESILQETEDHAKIAEEKAKIAEENQLFTDLRRLGMEPKYIRTALRSAVIFGGTDAENRKIALDILRERLERLKRAPPSKT